ncbi:hypothetical protein ES703_32663 [subsurface metagenome]
MSRIKRSNYYLLRIKKAEPFDKEVLPMLLSGSPDCSIDRTFISTFYFPCKATKINQIKHIYRNPIYLARECKRMIDNGQVKNQSSLARKLGISRVRICQILNLLKLNPLIIQELEKFGDPLKTKIITERMLRQYVNKSIQEQKELLNILKTLFKV